MCVNVQGCAGTQLIGVGLLATLGRGLALAWSGRGGVLRMGREICPPNHPSPGELGTDDKPSTMALYQLNFWKYALVLSSQFP